MCAAIIGWALIDGCGLQSQAVLDYLLHRVAGRLRIWDLYSGSLQQLLRPAEAAITSLQLVDSPSGSPACLAATGHVDGSCVFLDLGSGSQALTLPSQWQHRPSSNGAKDEQHGRHQPAFMTVAHSRPLCVVGQHRCLRGWDLRFLKGGSQTETCIVKPEHGECVPQLHRERRAQWQQPQKKSTSGKSVKATQIGHRLAITWQISVALAAQPCRLQMVFGRMTNLIIAHQVLQLA